MDSYVQKHLQNNIDTWKDLREYNGYDFLFSMNDDLLSPEPQNHINSKFSTAKKFPEKNQIEIKNENKFFSTNQTSFPVEQNIPENRANLLQDKLFFPSKVKNLQNLNLAKINHDESLGFIPEHTFRNPNELLLKHNQSFDQQVRLLSKDNKNAEKEIQNERRSIFSQNYENHLQMRNITKKLF